MARLACFVLLLTSLSPLVTAGDLPAASDGEHLWLINQAPAPDDDQGAGPQLVLYHLPAKSERYLATKLDPIPGELMPRGLAAGDGRLLIVSSERQMLNVRPVWSDLLQSWVYEKRSLTALPEGCTLVSLAIGDRGPWALVQVQSRALLEKLDQQDETQAAPNDQQMLNRALGLPEDLRWGESEQAAPDQDQDENEGAPGEEAAPADGEEQGVEEAVEPELPAYRLMTLRSSKWVSSPLPEGLAIPREAALLIRPEDDRPTLFVDSDRIAGQVLVRYNPVVPAERSADTDADADAELSSQAPSWVRVMTGMQLYPGRQWSATLVNDQIVVGIERNRPQDVVTIDTYRLRGNSAHEIGYASLSIGDNARWALLPKQNDIALIASPPPPPDPTIDQSKHLPSLAILAGLTIDGDPLFENEQGDVLLMTIAEKQPTAFEGNADLVIQILAFITAMLMMVMFYRRAPQQGQIDLPDHLVLASFSRRAIAGMVDLTPGFLLATLIYDVSISEIIFEAWPGNGIEKAFVAMRPGFVVIGVTLVHTTIMEFFLARSLGKILMGLYVSDLEGKPAPPMPCLGRALSRAFEFFAPLMILVAVISPARQRLGDILAKTTVVMQKPEAPPEPEND